MSDKILDALKKLDAGNDEHWTAGKQPTVAAVSELAGESVTREQIDAAAEGFSRDTAPGFFMTASSKPWEGPKDTVDPAEMNPKQATAIDAPDQNPGQDVDGNITAIIKNEDDITAGEEGDNVDAEGEPSGVPGGTGERTTDDSPGPPFNPADVQPVPAGDLGTGPQAIGDATESPRADGASEDDSESGGDGPDTAGDGEAKLPEMVESADTADEIASLEEELRSRKEDVAGLRLKADEARQAYNDAQGKADAIAERIEQLRPRNSNQATINAFLESEKRKNAERGDNRQALASAGVNIAALQKAVGKAPIDQAMARKTGRGTQRPSRT